MSAARRKWEQDLIATAALMGAEFQCETAQHLEMSADGYRLPNRIYTRWIVNIPADRTATHIRNMTGPRVRYQTQWQASYWYLVNVHRVSMQNNGEMLSCGVYGGLEHSEAAVRKHQSRTRERIRRSHIEGDRKWRREQKNISK